jgi:hypothetical protein
MTEGFQTVLAASERERRDLFLATANRLGTAEQNIEKDFWVCWTLDALFNGLEPGGPHVQVANESPRRPPLQGLLCAVCLVRICWRMCWSRNPMIMLCFRLGVV